MAEWMRSMCRKSKSAEWGLVLGDRGFGRTIYSPRGPFSALAQLRTHVHMMTTLSFNDLLRH